MRIYFMAFLWHAIYLRFCGNASHPHTQVLAEFCFISLGWFKTCYVFQTKYNVFTSKFTKLWCKLFAFPASCIRSVIDGWHSWLWTYASEHKMFHYSPSLISPFWIFKRKQKETAGKEIISSFSCVVFLRKAFQFSGYFSFCTKFLMENCQRIFCWENPWGWDC